MRSAEIPFKFKSRLNKNDSNDYQNISLTAIQEAVNKATLSVCRVLAHGGNIYKEGKDSSKTRISDLQVLLKTTPVAGTDKGIYFLSSRLPDDYFEHSMVTGIVNKDACVSFRIPSDLIENGNINSYLEDGDKQPSFEFEQSFHVLEGNKIKLYHNKQFEVKELELVYYKKPQFIQIPKAFMPDGGTGKDMQIQFKDDFFELILDEAVAIKAADIESLNRQALSAHDVETKN